MAERPRRAVDGIRGLCERVVLSRFVLLGRELAGEFEYHASCEGHLKRIWGFL